MSLLAQPFNRKEHLVTKILQASCNYRANHFLGALPSAFYDQQLFAYLQPCLFHLGDTIIDPRNDVKNLYFLKSGLISLVMEADDGVNVEVGLVGYEGVV